MLWAPDITDFFGYAPLCLMLLSVYLLKLISRSYRLFCIDLSGLKFPVKVISCIAWFMKSTVAESA